VGPPARRGRRAEFLSKSNGQGNALHALATGLGHAAVFEATNPSSIVSAVVAKRLGFEEKRLEPAPWADKLGQ
jgi:hypothetical protein